MILRKPTGHIVRVPLRLIRTWPSLIMASRRFGYEVWIGPFQITRIHEPR